MKIVLKPQNNDNTDGKDATPEKVKPVSEVSEKPKKAATKKVTPSAAKEKPEVKEQAPEEEKAEKPVKVVKAKKTVKEQAPEEEIPLNVEVSDEESEEKPAKERFTGGVQMALFPADEQKDEPEADSDGEPFDKAKLKKYFRNHPKKVINTKVERFSPKLNKGLTQKQVETRFRQFLFNDTNNSNTRSYTSIIVGNVCTFFNLLCLIAFIALLLASTPGFSNYLVIVITTINIAIGIFQEIRAKLSIDKLALLASNTVKVVRDGDTVEIDVKDVVLDDVLILELGNQVPADCILADGSVEVNESLLTGESIAIKKSVGDILYAGSFISSGNGKFRVEKVGRETYLEKLTSKAKKYRRPNSELMNYTKLIIKAVSLIIIPLAIFTFLTTLHHPEVGEKIFEDVTANALFSKEVVYAIRRTCTVIIGMIPSGMLLLTSVALALGILRLAKSNTQVKDMYSLEMLARVNVLCLDKTGTITDGRMKVNDTVILNTVGDYSVNDIMGSMLRELDSNNQTSIALFNHFGFSNALTGVAKIPFSSKRKLSAVTFHDVGTFAMGAPEFVLKPCPAKVERIVKQYANMGLRVIVLAHSTSPIVGDKLPSVMKPIAIISIADNVRDDAVDTIRWFKENDVNVKVISGDNPITVSEVAKRAGVAGAEKFISLDGLNDTEVENVANKYTVFGRVSPEQKAVLIRAIKAQGNTVAMTGDGVNDILALKEADCAISVASGSEAARNVSHLVLMDTNVNSMPKVVAEGRRVINNIQNSSALYLMKTLFTAFLATLCVLMSTPYLFMPQNMLLLEIAIIAVPSFFLSLQPNNERVQGKFISHVMGGALSGALLMILCVMTMYVLNQIWPNVYSSNYRAMCMLAMTFSGFVMVYRICQPLNLYRIVLCIGVLAVCLVALTVPLLTNLFLYTGWSDLKWEYGQILAIVVVIEAAFPLSGALIDLSHVLMPSTKKKRRSPEAK